MFDELLPLDENEMNESGGRKFGFQVKRNRAPALKIN